MLKFKSTFYFAIMLQSNSSRRKVMFYKREQYLNHLMELKNKTDLIKLVMGVRGAGKSTLFTGAPR